MKFFHTILALCLAFQAFGQLNVSGRVFNENNEALPFAAVYLSESKTSAVSDIDGNFDLEIPANIIQTHLDTLIVSYVGFERATVPIYFSVDTKSIPTIILKSNDHLLKKIEVFADQSYTPEEIVLEAIKNIKKNYSREQTYMRGFYREAVQEEGNWIVLNEAAFDLTYSAYPKRNIAKQASRHYWNKEYTRNNIFRQSDVFIHLMQYPYYVSKKDRIRFQQMRSSENHSRFGINASPVGGPMDLIAFDKVKYMTDFLDPDLMEQYVYKLPGISEINGQACYVIDFYPNPETRKQGVLSVLEKFRYAIYSGKIYIDKTDFSVHKIEGQFASGINLRSLKGSGAPVMKYLGFEINYERVKGRMILQNVKTEQRNIKNLGNNSLAYTCFRELHLTDPVKYNAGKHKEKFVEKVPRIISIANECPEYLPVYWKVFEQGPLYKELNDDLVKQLEAETDLKNQFSNINLKAKEVEAPVNRKVAGKLKTKFESIPDDYRWIWREEEALKTYLYAENRYYNQVMRKWNADQKQFYRAYGKIDLRDTVYSNSLQPKPSECTWKYDEKGNYKLYRNQQELINYTTLSKGKVSFNIEQIEFSNQGALAYTYSEKDQLFNALDINLEGQITSIKNVNDFLWLNDSVILYTSVDHTSRSSKLYAHNLKNKIEADSLLYVEKDPTYDIHLKKSTSGLFNWLVVQNMDFTEYYELSDSLTLVRRINRDDRLRCQIEHFGGEYVWLLLNNSLYRTKGAFITTDTKLMCKTEHPITAFRETKDFIALIEFNINTCNLIAFNKAENEASRIELSTNPVGIRFLYSEISNNIIQLVTEGYLEGNKTWEINLETGNKKLLNEKVLTAGKHYESELLWVKHEAVKVPVTTYYAKENLKEPKGLILKAYGAYGATQYPQFNQEDLVYLNEGVIVAYVHCRGGGELGDSWYQGGKKQKKGYTFHDFIVATEFLQKKFNISPENTIGYGTSAGGTIMGYVANNRPELYGALIFDKPYLDVLGTMINDSLPLTTLEYEEWGNPNDQRVHDYMKMWSPYQNIKSQSHPNMLFLGKYYDQQALIQQVASSVSKYREYNQGTNLILFQTDFNSGHRGAKNQASIWQEKAQIYAFIMNAMRN